MFKSSSLVLVVALCAGLALTLVHGQGVNSRAASPDQPRIQSDSAGSGSGASRNVYAQRQLSPHRMMHFGKRLLRASPPTMPFDPSQVARYLVEAPINDQELRQEEEAARREQERELDSVSKFPYTLYFDLPHNRVLEPVLEDPFLRILMMVNMLREKEAERAQQRQQQRQKQKQKRMMMHVQSRALVDGAAAAAGGGERRQQDEVVVQVAPPTMQYEEGNKQEQRFAELNQIDGNEQQASSTEKSPTSNSSEEQAPTQENNADSINLVSRSPPPMPFGEPIGGPPSPDPYTKAQIFNYLYGRPASSTVTFKRKAEPGRMTFMHFG